MTTPIRRAPAVADQVGAYLHDLVTRELAPGDRVPPERELAQLLDVSRGAVRDALQVLERRRLVDRRPGRGTVVLPPAARETALAGALSGVLDAMPDEDDHVAELRRVVEPEVAALAAVRATGADLVALERTLADSHAGLSPAESLRLDVRFHTQVAQASGNPLLRRLLTTASEWTTDVRRHSHDTRTGRRRSVEGHRAILAAIETGDADAAAAAMDDHLRDVADLVGRSRARRTSPPPEAP